VSALHRRLADILGSRVAGTRSVGGGDICTAYQVTLVDERVVFAKTLSGAPSGFFTAEAAGLRWLADAVTVTGRTAPTPTVLGVADELIVLEWVDHGRPSLGAAEQFGLELAATHRFGAAVFGADAGLSFVGFVGSLPLDNTPSGNWPEFYAQRRLLPYLKLAADQGAIDRNDREAVETVIAHLDVLAGPEEPPARIHGDLWSGNLLWGADGRVRLVDPAAHGGHRETDLAMLALFGTPYLDHVLGAYREACPLADGWRHRVPLHQLHPMLVHAALFGGGYGERAGALARRLLG
jgi:fructosamine-3-kinase